jgi:hypothetical protein
MAFVTMRQSRPVQRKMPIGLLGRAKPGHDGKAIERALFRCVL